MNKHIMKQLLALCLGAGLSINISLAESLTPGLPITTLLPGAGTCDNPYRIGAITGPFNFSHRKDTHECENFIGEKSNECCYEFSVDRRMLVIANHAGSEITRSSVALYETGSSLIELARYPGAQSLESTRDLWRHYESIVGEEIQSLVYNNIEGQGFMCQIVEPGDYLIVSEGISGNLPYNGVIKTNIHILEIPGSTSNAPYLWGTYGSDFEAASDFDLINFHLSGENTARVYGQITLNACINLTIRQLKLFTSIPSIPSINGIQTSSGQELMLVSESGQPLGNIYHENLATVIQADSLAPGNYFICSELTANDAMTLKLTVMGERFEIPGMSLEHPINLGTLSPETVVRDIKDSRDYPNHTAPFCNRIYYRFSTEELSQVEISTQNSPLRNTAIMLTDNEGIEITNNCFIRTDSLGAYIFDCHYLPAGTYYFIVEGRYENGIIHSTLTVNEVSDKVPEPEVFAPSVSRNYIMSISPTREIADLESTALRIARYSIAYYNGLGLPDQTVLRGATPDKRDLISAVEYNNRGLASREWQPGAQLSTGQFISPSDLFALACELHGDERPFSETSYELSPLNRVLNQSGPGSAWHDAGRETAVTYLLNTQTHPLNCRLFRVINGQLVDAGWYPSGALNVKSSLDEDYHTSYTFTDKFGRTLLERHILENGAADTYYVYNLSGDLSFVLPPAFFEHPNTEGNIERYAFAYKYDVWHRLIEKKLPGSSPVRLIYDACDRVIFMQDGEQRLRDEWTITLQDRLGRQAITGICAGDPDIGTLAASDIFVTRDSSHPIGYSLGTVPLPVDGITLLRVDYYDDYSFLGNWSCGDSLRYRSDTRFGSLPGNTSASVAAKDQLTGSIIYDTSGQNPRYTTYYYDFRHRVIQRRTADNTGFLSVNKAKYTFTGLPELTCEAIRITADAATDSLNVKSIYDHMERLKQNEIQLNDGAPVIVRNEYDALGRLAAIRYGSGADTLRTDMHYNIRGWLTDKLSDDFAMQLRYTDPQYATPSYGGNIAEWSWQQGSEEDPRTYTFAYDALSRITGSELFENGVKSDRFAERGISYDLNGNILSLERTSGGTVANDLEYTYDGNRLATLTDGAESYAYAYDVNGNMTHDGAYGLDISYNRLNMLQKVSQNGSVLANYSYLSDGTKLSATNADGNGFRYEGSLVYRIQNGALSLESAAFNGGRFVATDSGMEPRYFLADHLGSTRAVVNAAGKVLERNDYYPFGLRWEDPESLLSDNRYRYNGKEEQAFVDVPYVDYGARMSDARYRMAWNGIDPMAEKYYAVSPYTFCTGNPILFVDPDGQKIYFAPGVSQEFKDKFTQTIQYMNDRGSAGDIAALEASEKVYYIDNICTYIEDGEEKEKTNAFESVGRTIYWDPNTAYQTRAGIWVSPATILAHEAGHAKAYDDDPEEYLKNNKTNDSQYGTKEEERNITTTEQQAARRHKEIMGTTVTRTDHHTANREDVSNQTPYETEKIFEKRNEIMQTY